MLAREGKRITILSVVLSVACFSLLLMLDSLVGMSDIFADGGWPLTLILAAIVLIRAIFAGFAVLVVLPLVLRMELSHWLAGYLKIDRKGVLLGLLSFAVFCVLAAAISLGMGIFKGDVSAVFARPDIRPDPDIVGWGFFLLALVPGIWEELAFRGLIQSKLQRTFSTRSSVLLAAVFFALFHFSNLLSQPPSQVVGGVVMAFAFGLGWSVMTVRARSVIPAMLSHYLVDSMGTIFLRVDGANPALVTGFFLLLTVTFSIINIVLAGAMYRYPAPAD